MATEDLIREALDPHTSAARLAELVQADPATWSAVAAHPAAYPGLLQWLSERGDPATNVALSSRASAPAPTEVLPTTPPPVAETVAETAAEPTAEPTDEPAAEATAEIPADMPVEPTVVVPAVEQTAPIEATAPVEATAPAGPTVPMYAPAAPTGNEPGKRNFWILAGMVAVVLVLIGGIAFGATKVFGGDDNKNDATSSKTSEPTSSPTDEPTDDFPTDEPTDEFTTDDPSSGDESEFCDAMAAIQDASMNAIPSGGTPNLGDLKDMADTMTSAYADLSAAAPPELTDEIEIMSSFLKILENPTADAAKEFTDNMDKYTEAVTKVSKYYTQHCS